MNLTMQQYYSMLYYNVDREIVNEGQFIYLSFNLFSSFLFLLRLAQKFLCSFFIPEFYSIKGWHWFSNKTAIYHLWHWR